MTWFFDPSHPEQFALFYDWTDALVTVLCVAAAALLAYRNYRSRLLWLTTGPKPSTSRS